MSDETYEITTAKLVRKTEKAGLFKVDNEELWIPFSQCENAETFDAPGATGPLVITEWIAKQKGLIVEPSEDDGEAPF